MANSKKAAKEAVSQTSRPKVEQVAEAEKASDQAGVEAVLARPSPNGGEGVDQQAARLRDPRLQAAQRENLAQQIGKHHGNQHLQRLITTGNGTTDPASAKIGRSKKNGKTALTRSKNGRDKKSDLAQEGEENIDDLGGAGIPSFMPTDPPINGTNGVVQREEDSAEDHKSIEAESDLEGSGGVGGAFLISADTPPSRLNGAVQRAEESTGSTAEPGSSYQATERIGSESVFWSVDYKVRKTYLIPTKSIGLEALGDYLYNDHTAAVDLAKANGIPADTRIAAGTRLIVAPIKGRDKASPAAAGHYRSGPRIPPQASNPFAWLDSIGVSSPKEFTAKKVILEAELDKDFVLIYLAMSVGSTIQRIQAEGDVIKILKRWGEEKFYASDHWYPEGGEYFDRLLMKLRGKTKKIGYFDEITDYYSMLFNRFHRVDEVIALRNAYSKDYRQDSGIGEISFNDAVVDAVKGLPGATTMVAGAFISMLPGKWSKTAGNWLNKQGRGYLAAVGWDEDMIDQASQISGVTGMTMAMIMPGGASAKVAQFIERADQIISTVQKAKEIIDLKERLLTIKDFIEAKVKIIVELAKKPEKLMLVLLGLEEDQTGLIEWVMGGPSETTESGEKGAKGIGQGIGKLIAKVKGYLEKVRTGLQPIFRIREKFITFLETAGALILQVPFASEMLEMAMDPKKRRKASFRTIVGQFSTELAGLVQQKIEGIRESIVGKIQGVFGEGEIITSEDVLGAITKLVKNVIRDQLGVAVADSIELVDQGDLVKKHVVEPMLGGPALAVVGFVNEKFSQLKTTFKPQVEAVIAGVGAVAEGIKEAVNGVLVDGLKKAFGIKSEIIQPKLSDEKDPKPTTIHHLQSKIYHHGLRNGKDRAHLPTNNNEKQSRGLTDRNQPERQKLNTTPAVPQHHGSPGGVIQRAVNLDRIAKVVGEKIFNKFTQNGKIKTGKLKALLSISKSMEVDKARKHFWNVLFSRDDLQKFLGVSKSQAVRKLKAWTKQGDVKKVGGGSKTKYQFGEGKVNVEPLKKYRPGWRESTKQELAAYDPGKHKPGSTKLRTEKATSRKGKTYDRQKYDRRHITAYNDLKTDLIGQIKGKTYQAAASILNNKGYPPEKEENYYIIEAAKAYLRHEFNDIANLFVGGAEENQALGRQLGQAKKDMQEARSRGDKTAFKEAYKRYREATFDPEPIEYFYDKFSSIRERLDEEG